MKKRTSLLIGCLMMLLAFSGCGGQEPVAVSAEPVFPESEITSVLYMDYDETWYLLQEGDSALPEAADILGSIRGREIPRPEDSPAGTYTFDVTFGGETHALSMTGNYCVLDGVWYHVEQGQDAALAECLRSNGTVIPKEEWSHSARWLRPEMYFWKNTEVTCSEGMICYAEAPWASDKCYSDDEVTALGILPDLDGYTSQSLSVYYNEDGSVWELIAHWQYYDEAEPSAYKQLELEIWPEKPGEDEPVDGMISFDPKKLTETKIRDGAGNLISVYGDGTLETRCKYLIFTLADGSYCQITAFDTVDAGDMAAILDYLVTNGVNYSLVDGTLDTKYHEIPTDMRNSQASEIGLEMIMKDVTKTGATIQFVVTNPDAASQWLYGDDYSLETYVDGQWQRVPDILNGNYGFAAVAFSIDPDTGAEWIVDWEWLYGALPPGRYRMEKNVQALQGVRYKDYLIYGYFDIPE